MSCKGKKTWEAAVRAAQRINCSRKSRKFQGIGAETIYFLCKLKGCIFTKTYLPNKH